MLFVLSIAYLLLIPLSVRRFLAYQRADELAAEAAAAGKEGGAALGDGSHA
jgi:hypothetical protein